MPELKQLTFQQINIHRQMELSKKEKDEIRTIIESGLQREFEKGLSEAQNILTDWKTNSRNNRDSYQQLYKHITDFDKHISRKYDRISGSTYLFIVAGQLIDGVITESDLSNLSDNVKQAIKMIANI